MPSRRTFLSTVAGASLLAGCGADATDRANAEQTVTPAPVPASTTRHRSVASADHAPRDESTESSADPLPTAWTLDVPVVHDWTTAPVPHRDTVFFGGVNYGDRSADRWYAVDVRDGTVRWETPAVGVAGRPAVTDRAVVVTENGSSQTGTNPRVRLLDPTGGAEQWATGLDTERVYAPTVDGGTVFVRSRDASHAVALDGGSERWRHDGGTFDRDWEDVMSEVAPTVDDGTVYTPEPNAITARDVDSGRARWRVTTEKVRATPTVHEGTLYATGVKTGLVAATEDGVAWTWDGPGQWNSPAVAETVVYTTQGSDIVALDHDGVEQWRTSGHGLHADVYASPVLTEESVVGCGGYIVAYDRWSPESPTPAERWRNGLEAAVTPAVTDDLVLVPTRTRQNEVRLVALGRGE